MSPLTILILLLIVYGVLTFIGATLDYYKEKKYLPQDERCALGLHRWIANNNSKKDPREFVCTNPDCKAEGYYDIDLSFVITKPSKIPSNKSISEPQTTNIN